MFIISLFFLYNICSQLLRKMMVESYDILMVLHVNNFTLHTIDSDVIQDVSNEKASVISVPYERKYDMQYNIMDNVYKFRSDEYEKRDKYKKDLKKIHEQNKKQNLNVLQYDLNKLLEIEKDTTNNSLFDHNDIREPDKMSSNDIQMLQDSLKKEISELNNNIVKLTNYVLSSEDIEKYAESYMIKLKLDNMINNYIYEQTPNGYVILRYNNSKKLFEYYSNSFISNKYLETIGKKYVCTYFCKPIFIDVDNKENEENEENEENKKENDNTFSKVVKNIMNKRKLSNTSNLHPSLMNKTFRLNSQKSDIKMKNNMSSSKSNSSKLTKSNLEPEPKPVVITKYLNIGKINDYNPLQIIKKDDTKTKLSFHDFKRMNKK